MEQWPQTGDVLRGTGLLCSKKAAPVVPGPLFLLSTESVPCQIGLGLMSGAKCHSAIPFDIVDSSFLKSRATNYIPQKVEIFIYPDFSAYLMKYLSAVPQSDGNLGLPSTMEPASQTRIEVREGGRQMASPLVYNTQHGQL